MTTEEILNLQTTKTEKIRLLLMSGLTRKQVAETMGIGYGFVQNVYAKMNRIIETITNQINTTFEFNFNRTFGIEIEAFGVGREILEEKLNAAGISTRMQAYGHRTEGFWKITSDGSIQGNGQPTFELVSPVLQGEGGLQQLTTVCRVLAETGAKVNKSCGLHIHLGAEDYDLEAWKNLYFNYATFEQTIDSFMPSSRRASNNNYCKSMRKTSFAAKINEATSLEDLERKLTSRNRYHKLNTQAFWRQRTVEFRQHGGTIEYDKISNWILFVARLTEFSKTNRTTGGTLEAAEVFITEEMKTFFQTRINKFRAAA